MTDAPTIEVTGDARLSDAAIEAWGRVLLDLAERETAETGPEVGR